MSIPSAEKCPTWIQYVALVQEISGTNCKIYSFLETTSTSKYTLRLGSDLTGLTLYHCNDDGPQIEKFALIVNLNLLQLKSSRISLIPRPRAAFRHFQ